MTIRDTDLRLALTSDQITGAAIMYARSGVIRMADPLSIKTAEALHHHLDTQVPWGRTVSQGEIAWDLNPEAVAAMDADGAPALLAEAHNTARSGFQFVFDSLIVSDDPAERSARGLLVDRLVDVLNRPETLDAFRSITGVREIRSINGQATRYLPGHFLTSHDDGIADQDRVAAYVLNLSKGWRTDWGGLLQFHNSAGDVPLALKPGFNTLHLFRVPQMHSVSYVAPFAAVPRYAITGWLCR